MPNEIPKKRIVILTMNPKAGLSYKATLEEITGRDALEILVHTPSSYQAAEHISDVNLYLISTSAIEYTGDMTYQVPLGVPVVDITVAFKNDSIERISRIPRGTRCLFVNTTEPLALEGIVALHRYSIYNVILTPYYLDGPDEPEIDVAITAGEPQLVPSRIKTVYDLGHRYLTPGTIIEVLLSLNMESIMETEVFHSYCSQFHLLNRNENMLLKKSLRLEAGIDMLINATEGGMVGINEEERIFCINHKAMEILGLKDTRWIGRPYGEVVPFIDFQKYAGLRDQERVYDQLIQYSDTPLTVSIRTIFHSQKFRGLFINLQRFIDVENKQHDARLRLLNKGHKAKYTFDDIVGQSETMQETCRMARKMARTNSAILITGESGTGKELLASAIHNASQRSSYPYVAINCAAMPENLLESELFGYEEGAFTGARKNGKLGLFEYAHKGTLFLDEIEDMSPALQVKLLRVLQEKEVMRLGGTKIINVDVRIIAATNVDMETMVHQGLIRKDLYYRLNTMQLDLPPLRKRREDIPLLIRHMQAQVGTRYHLSDAVMERILAHNWDGNVRELKNYVEFFQCLEKEEIQLEDLPKRLQCESCLPEEEIQSCDLLLVETSGVPASESPAETEASAASISSGRPPEQQFILECLYRSFLENRLIGRRTICQAARKINLLLTEQEVRRLLKQLESEGLVRVGCGRAGSRLTPQGIAALSAQYRRTCENQVSPPVVEE